MIDLTLYQCKKGNHDFRPVACSQLPKFYADRIPQRRGRIGWKVMIRGTAKYDHGDIDQLDWNKLPGLSYNTFTNHENSAMLGWRWSVDKQSFELSPYLHVSGHVVKDFAPVEEILPGKVFWYSLENDFQGSSVKLQIWKEGGLHRIYAPFEYEELNSLTRIIHGWFGGNRTAPHDMHIAYEQIKQWAQDEQGNWWPWELYVQD